MEPNVWEVHFVYRYAFFLLLVAFPGLECTPTKLFNKPETKKLVSCPCKYLNLFSPFMAFLTRLTNKTLNGSIAFEFEKIYNNNTCTVVCALMNNFSNKPLLALEYVF